MTRIRHPRAPWRLPPARVLPAVVLAAAVALASGCGAARAPGAAGGDPGRAAPGSAEPRAPATQVVAQARSMDHPLLGKAAPAWTLPDLAGRERSLQSFRGAPAVLVYWTTW